MARPIIIGIAGGTGSGKTTITNNLQKRFRQDISVVYHDNYYKAHDELSYDERCRINYDCPDAFDTDLMVHDLLTLRSGEQICCPVYDFSAHNRSNRTVCIDPAPVIIVEGTLVLACPELCEMLDIRVFVDTEADVRVLRRIMRDMRYRGRSLDSVINQYLTTVKPMHELYVEPSKNNANIIIPEGGHNQVAVEMLAQSIKALIDRSKQEDANG